MHTVKYPMKENVNFFISEREDFCIDREAKHHAYDKCPNDEIIEI